MNFQIQISFQRKKLVTHQLYETGYSLSHQSVNYVHMAKVRTGVGKSLKIHQATLYIDFL